MLQIDSKPRLGWRQIDSQKFPQHNLGLESGQYEGLAGCRSTVIVGSAGARSISQKILQHNLGLESSQYEGSAGCRSTVIVGSAGARSREQIFLQQNLGLESGQCEGSIVLQIDSNRRLGWRRIDFPQNAPAQSRLRIKSV